MPDRHISCHVHLERYKMGLAARTRQKIDNHIERRETFKYGNVSAIRYNAGETPQTGILPGFLRDQLKAVAKDNDLYIVYSYQTPIGWSVCDGNDNWFIPDVKYSVSTTHHQSLLKMVTR